MFKEDPCEEVIFIQRSTMIPGEGNGNPLQYSCLENSMDRGAWWATVHGVAKSRTRLSDFTPSLILFQSSCPHFTDEVARQTDQDVPGRKFTGRGCSQEHLWGMKEVRFRSAILLCAFHFLPQLFFYFFLASNLFSPLVLNIYKIYILLLAILEILACLLNNLKK